MLVEDMREPIEQYDRLMGAEGTPHTAEAVREAYLVFESQL